MTCDYRPASAAALECLWNKNIAANPGDGRWVRWKEQYLRDNADGRCKTFAVFINGEPVGEGTLLLSPACGAIAGRTQLADGRRVLNLNALRIEKAYEGQGHISRLVKEMEVWAKAAGFEEITIGAEADEARNLAIYLHWGYDRLVHWEVEDGALVLYYARRL